MELEMLNKCIKSAIERLTNNKNRMSTYAYITYFVKKHNLSMEEDWYIREEVSKYIDKHLEELFPVSI